MTENIQEDWPLLVAQLPSPPSEELAATFSAVALEAGALGGQLDGAQLTIYLPRELDAAALAEVQRALEEQAGQLEIELAWEARALPDAPWATAWKENFRTMPVGERLLIRPDWELDVPAPEEWRERLPIFLRPGQGFGTGHHETTALALSALEAQLPEGKRVLDFGAGSGVLSIAAWRLGAREALGIECDEPSVENAHENFELNACPADKVSIILGATPSLASGAFELVICNVLPQYALVHLGGLASKVVPTHSARLIYSGFLVTQLGEIEQAVQEATGLKVLARHELGEWALVVAGNE